MYIHYGTRNKTFRKFSHLANIRRFPESFRFKRTVFKCGLGSKYLSGLSETILWNFPDKCVSRIDPSMSVTTLDGQKSISRSLKN